MTAFKTGQKMIKIEYTSVIELNFLVRLTEQLKNKTDLIFELEKVQLKDVAENLKNGRFDLAISVDSEFMDETLLQVMPLYQGNYAALVGKNHPLYKQSSITAEQLYASKLVMLSPDTIGKSYHLMLNHAKEDGYFPNIVKTVSDLETELFLVQTEQLVCFFPDNYPLPAQQNDVKLLPIKDTNHKFEIVFAYRKDFDRSQLQQVITAVKDLQV